MIRTKRGTVNSFLTIAGLAWMMIIFDYIES